MTKNCNRLMMILAGVALICIFAADVRAWGVPYPGGEVRWNDNGNGSVRYPGGQVRWGKYDGGVRFPGGHVRWEKRGRGGAGINLPGVNFNVGW